MHKKSNLDINICRLSTGITFCPNDVKVDIRLNLAELEDTFTRPHLTLAHTWGGLDATPQKDVFLSCTLNGWT